MCDDKKEDLFKNDDNNIENEKSRVDYSTLNKELDVLCHPIYSNKLNVYMDGPQTSYAFTCLSLNKACPSDFFFIQEYLKCLHRVL